MPNAVKSYKRISTCAGLLLLYLMVVFPMTLNLLYIKAGLFALLLLMTALSWAAGFRTALHQKIMIWGALVATIGAFFSFTGLVGSTPGAMKQLQVYAFWPLVYVAILGGASDERVLIQIHRTLVAATISISTYGLIVLLTALGELPQFPVVEWLSFEEEEGGGLTDNFFAIRYQGMNSLPFLIPYIMASLVAGVGNWRSKFLSRIVLWAALVSSLFVTVISGRRAIQVVVMLAPLILIWLGSHQIHWQRKATRARLNGLLVACVAIVFLFFLYLASNYNASFEDMISGFTAGFDFSAGDNEATYARQEQWYALLAGWEAHPLLGNGHGASAIGSIRSLEMPWAYELYYVALLFQVGLLGFAAYSVAIAWIYWKGFTVISHGGTLGKLMLASLVALTGVLIATATNPYLMRFDGLWVIFIPLAVVNRWLLGQRKKLGESATQLSVALRRGAIRHA